MRPWLDVTGQSEECRQVEEGQLVSDLPTGPKQPKSVVLTIEEEVIVIGIRRHTLLPLAQCLYALQSN